ncbi:MAG: hypothetical protein OXE84_02020, partial [Rhodobacteraceae bacterium]|nr:hypothetical protein [Paracoccaceae bacterium]
PTSHPSKLCDLHSSCHPPRRLVPPFSACNADTKTRPALKTQGNCQRALAEIPSRACSKIPWPFDRALYRELNRIKQFFGTIKEFCLAASRYDKTACNFLSGVQLAVSRYLLRASAKQSNGYTAWAVYPRSRKENQTALQPGQEFGMRVINTHLRDRKEGTMSAISHYSGSADSVNLQSNRAAAWSRSAAGIGQSGIEAIVRPMRPVD